MMSWENSNILVEISPDRKSAWLKMKKGYTPTRDEINAELHRASVMKGIKEETLLRIVQGEMEEDSVKISEFIPPVEGTPATLEYLVSCEAKPLERENGSLNFREINLIKNVRKGDPLARKTPPGSGTPGYLVTGEILPPQPGRDLNLSTCAGEGTEVSQRNPNLIIAARDGVYSQSPSGQIRVLAELLIPSDVDYSTGNIHSFSRLHIKGDVKSGFELDCERDITINGLIENALVNVRGDLHIRMGITQGTAPIMVGGTLSTMYIYHRTAVQASEVRVREMISFSHLFVDGDVSAKRIVGGEIIAQGDITCEIAGSNRLQSRTLLVAGLDLKKKERCYELQTRLDEKNKALAERTKNLEILLEWKKKYDEHYGEKSPGMEDNQEPSIPQYLQENFRMKLARLSECQREIAEMRGYVKDIEGEIALLKPEISNRSAKIIVNGTLFAGVSVAIGDIEPLVIEQQLEKVVFRLNDEGEMVYQQ